EADLVSEDAAAGAEALQAEGRRLELVRVQVDASLGEGGRHPREAVAAVLAEDLLRQDAEVEGRGPALALPLLAARRRHGAHRLVHPTTPVARERPKVAD